MRDRTSLGFPPPNVMESYNERLIALVREAHRDRVEIAGWLGECLGQVAEELPQKADGLLARRLGSWEAGLVRQLINGTIGWPGADF